MNPYQTPAELATTDRRRIRRIAKITGMGLMAAVSLSLVVAMIGGVIGIVVETYRAISRDGFWTEHNAIIPIVLLLIAAGLLGLGAWLHDWGDDLL